MGSIDEKPPNPNGRQRRKTKKLFDYVIDEKFVDKKPPNLGDLLRKKTDIF